MIKIDSNFFLKTWHFFNIPEFFLTDFGKN